MAGKTVFWKLDRLSTGNKLSDNSFKYTDADRVTIDFALYQGTTAHRHDGTALAPEAPDTAPELTVIENSGAIPAGRTVFYRYTYVLDNGLESLPSPESFITTTAPISIPVAPTLASKDPNGGTLPPGTYQYKLSAWRGSNTLETPTQDAYAIQCPGPTSTYKFCFTLPNLPTNADGFNVYRRKANEGDFYFMASIDMTVATPPDTWCDDGSITANQARTPANYNLTGQNNSVEICLPGATPALPDGYQSWKIYRTLVPGDYTNSLLHNVVEQVTEPSGPVVTCYTDFGESTSRGSFPQFANELTNPDPVNMNNMVEVQGYLPVGRNLIPYEMDFTYEGLLSLLDDATPLPRPLPKLWTCEFQYAEIVGIRAVLGYLSAPQDEDVIVDVLKYNCNHATPTWESLYQDGATPNDKPYVPVGTFCGPRTVPNTTTLGYEDILRVDIEQIGGSATPADYDLTVTVYMLVRDTRGDDTVSETGILGLS